MKVGIIMAVYRVVFHINEQSKWKSVLGNVSNLLKDLGDEPSEVVVLANGNSVRYYEETVAEEDLKKLSDLADKGVQFLACNNSLNAQSLSKEDLQSFVEIVPAGVTALIRKQNDGFAYIKP